MLSLVARRCDLGGGSEQQRTRARVVGVVKYTSRVVLRPPPDTAGRLINVGRDRAELVCVTNFQSTPVVRGMRVSWHLLPPRSRLAKLPGRTLSSRRGINAPELAAD